MCATHRSEVLATGPYFADPKHPCALQRAILVKAHRALDETTRFLVLIQTKGDPSIRRVKRTDAAQLTYAVRIFCDCILDQALARDIEEERPRPRQAS
jgi:hypothetical protein